MVGWDENMCGLLCKREQREGEWSTHSTHSIAGVMLACLWVARGKGWRGSHHPVTHSDPWGVLGEDRAQGGVNSLLL